MRLDDHVAGAVTCLDDRDNVRAERLGLNIRAEDRAVLREGYIIPVPAVGSIDRGHYHAGEAVVVEDAYVDVNHLCRRYTNTLRRGRRDAYILNHRRHIIL